MDEKTNLHLRSEMAQEIISHQPDFLEKWALLIFTAILLTLVAASWFVKYPDIIETSATLTAFNAPKELVVRQEGRLVKLLAHNNELVRRGEVLGWIESTADPREVLALSGQLDSSGQMLDAGQIWTVSRLNNLGELQQSYQTFIAALQLFNDYTGNGFFIRKKAMLEGDVSALDSSNHTIRNQKTLTEQDLRLAQETFNMNKKLFDEKVISQEELRSENSKVLNKQMAIPQLDASLLSNDAQKRDKQKELEQIDHDIAQQRLTFRQALQSLKSQVDDWKKRFLLLSPVDGKVVFIIPLQENQFLQEGKLVGFVNPSDSHFYVETNLSQNNFGKLDTGMEVQLRFDAYPYQETGFVGGTLNYISNVPSDSGFLANIRLNKGLVTNSGHTIPYKSGLKAQAIIITRNMRLLQRLWYGFNKSASVGSK